MCFDKNVKNMSKMSLFTIQYYKLCYKISSGQKILKLGLFWSSIDFLSNKTKLYYKMSTRQKFDVWPDSMGKMTKMSIFWRFNIKIGV